MLLRQLHGLLPLVEQHAAVDGRLDVVAAQDDFVLDVNGTLIFQERANTIGEYVVTLKSMDDAGTASPNGCYGAAAGAS